MVTVENQIQMSGDKAHKHKYENKYTHASKSWQMSVHIIHKYTNINCNAHTQADRDVTFWLVQNHCTGLLQILYGCIFNGHTPRLKAGMVPLFCSPTQYVSVTLVFTLCSSSPSVLWSMYFVNYFTFSSSNWFLISLQKYHSYRFMLRFHLMEVLPTTSSSTLIHFKQWN